MILLIYLIYFQIYNLETKMGSYLGKQMEDNFDKQQKFMMEMNR